MTGKSSGCSFSRSSKIDIPLGTAQPTARNPADTIRDRRIEEDRALLRAPTALTTDPEDHWTRPDQDVTTTQVRERAPDQEPGPRLNGNDGLGT